MGLGFEPRVSRPGPEPWVPTLCCCSQAAGRRTLPCPRLCRLAHTGSIPALRSAVSADGSTVLHSPHNPAQSAHRFSQFLLKHVTLLRFQII